MLAHVSETIIEICFTEDRLKPLCFVSLDGYSWDAILKYTKTELENIQEADSVLVFGIIVRSRKSGFMEKRFLVSVDDHKILDIDSYDLYGLGMSHPLPHSEKEIDETVGLKKKVLTANDTDNGYAWEVGVKKDQSEKRLLMVEFCAKRKHYQYLIH